MIHYKIAPSPLDHEWHILLKFTQDNDFPIEISLPNWVPGSYLIRDFSRHITSIHASCNGTSMPLEQIAKNRWHTAAVRGEWQIRYTVYAFDLSVRGSFLTTERGFFDGSCLFLKIEGTETLPHRLELTGIPPEWRIATTLPETGRLVFQTASYDELIDRPVEMGLIEFLDFEAAGIPHTIALSGIYPDFDRDRLVSDIKKSAKQNWRCSPPLPHLRNICSCSTSATIFTAVWNTPTAPHCSPIATAFRRTV